MTTTIDHDTGELFDGTAYTIPFPPVDGHDVDELVLRISGAIKLNRNDQEHVDLIDSMRLGGYVHLSVFAAITGKADTYKAADNGDTTVTHNVGLRIETINRENR